ncbi:hypothetical protein R1flu_010311 [Riccia fluitans]|uniref:Uncharacterized protein n=1 Tax=Riccia fluitans TaxID=41844 RepID=A0ABD1Z746_9MARC
MLLVALISGPCGCPLHSKSPYNLLHQTWTCQRTAGLGTSIRTPICIINCNKLRRLLSPKRSLKCKILLLPTATDTYASDSLTLPVSSIYRIFYWSLRPPFGRLVCTSFKYLPLPQIFNAFIVKHYYSSTQVKVQQCKHQWSPKHSRLNDSSVTWRFKTHNRPAIESNALSDRELQ